MTQIVSFLKKTDLAAPFEFEGIDGEFHALHGCSVAGSKAFEKRIAALVQIMEREQSRPCELYLNNKHFKRHCDEALRLNRIDPDWVSPQMLNGLLFFREDDDGTMRPGLLLELNDWEGVLQAMANADRDDDDDAEGVGAEDLDTPGKFAGVLAADERISPQEAAWLVSEPPALFVAELMGTRSKLIAARQKKAEEEMEARIPRGGKGMGRGMPQGGINSAAFKREKARRRKQMLERRKIKEAGVASGNRTSNA